MAILVTHQLFFKSTELSAQTMGLAKTSAMTSTIQNDTLYKKFRVYKEKTSDFCLGENLAAWKSAATEPKSQETHQ